jgi:beta-N-acetylhexosaminidase
MRLPSKTTLLALALLSCAVPVAHATPSTDALAERAAAAAQAEIDRRLIGQRLIYGFGGTEAPRSLLARIRRGHVAGVILFSANYAGRAQARRLTARLQRAAREAPAAARAPLLVMVDQEGGAVRRIPGSPGRSAAELAATGRVSVVRAAGRAAGRNVGDLGINVNLAPVLDVARAGSAIEDFGRAFGRDAQTVGRMGPAFVRGLHDAGVAATAKHFPGFGAARANTDDEPVTLRMALRTLRSVDEAPYRSAIEAGVELVMLSSAIYTALDRRQPASFSRKVVEGELRERLGFDGVTITDALGTPGVLRYGSPAQVAVRAAAAGNDLLLYVREDEGVAAMRALERAVAAGRLGRAELRRSADRVLALRRSLGWSVGG